MQRICRPARELAQMLADRTRGVPADAGVDLVEHQQRRAPRRPPPPPWATLSSASMTRESSPPEAISRSGPAGKPGVGGDQQLDASAPRGPQPSGRGRSSTSNRASAIASSARRSRTAVASCGRRLAARARSAAGEPVQLRARLLRARSRPSLERDRRRARARSRRAGSARRGAAPRRSSLRACARAGRTAPGAPRPPRAAPGDASTPRQVAAQLAAEVLGLEAQRLQPRGERRQRRVDRGRRLELPRRHGPAARATSCPGLGGDRLRARRRPRSASVSRWRRRSRSTVSVGVLLLARRDGLDLAQLERDQIELSVARARQLAQLSGPLLEVAHALVGSPTRARSARCAGPQ